VPNEDVQDPAEVARMAEERAFDCLRFPDLTHIPASRETPFPLGGEPPHYFRRGYDPFVSLAAAAVATRRILLGTGICLIVQRDPIIRRCWSAATGPRVLDRVLMFGDEWSPNPMPLEDLAERITELRRRTAELGRSPIPVTVLGCPPELVTSRLTWLTRWLQTVRKS
jgi:alkanesulfonate monooxygenase SsuD/methylene tetrahydromethanopterin reductase-like flavin-dependent oxidoreductase (luciferase family)